MKGLTMQVRNVIMPDLLQVLVNVAHQVVAAIDAGDRIPEYTANLHDATGVAVYAYGSVTSFIPTKKATKKAHSGIGGVNRYGIDGHEMLVSAINEAQSKFSKGVWFVVFSTVPYAYYIDVNGSPIGRGKGFFRATYKEAVSEILSGLRPIAESVTMFSGTEV